jgi:SAM-dependent methyltransferase
MSENGFERAWRTRFHEFAEASDDDAGIAGWSATGLAARFRRFGDLWAGRRISGCWIDAGCGAATYARYLSARGAIVIGVDYSLPSLVKARGRGTAGISFVVADVRRLPLRRGGAEGALCFGVTQALANSEDAIAELKECLGSGGELWIDGLNRYCLPNAFERLRRRMQGKPVHLRYESPMALKRALRKAGFVDVRLYWMPIMPKTLGSLQARVESASARAALRWVTPIASLISHAFIVAGRRPG